MLALLAPVVLFVILSIGPAIKAIGARRSPSEQEFLDLLAGRHMHYAAAQFILFKSGSASFMYDLRHAAYSPLTADTWWNRLLIARDAVDMDATEQSEFLPHYPFPAPDALVPILVNGLHAGDPRYMLVLDRSKAPSARNALNAWLLEDIVGPHDSSGLLVVLPYLTQCDGISVADVLRPFGEADGSTWRREALVAIAESEHLSDVAAKELMAVTRSFLDSTPAVPVAVRQKLLVRFLTAPSTRRDACAALWPIPGVATREDEWRWSAGPWDEALFQSIDEMTPSEMGAFAIEAFDATSTCAPSLAGALLYEAALADLSVAEAKARTVLLGDDCELRKNVIVVLQRLGSRLGAEHLDEAFKGSARRSAMFANTREYIYGSRAADEYRVLSGHDYLETGKTWPPTIMRPSAEVDRIDGWKRFIATYPWFPGTDDAYYRLASAQYIRADYSGAVQTYLEWAQVDLPDLDSIMCMTYLARKIAREHRELYSHYPILEDINTLEEVPLAQFFFGDLAGLERLEAALQRIRIQAKPERFTGLEAFESAAMDTAIAILRSEAPDTRMKAIYDHFSTMPSLVPAVFYGPWDGPDIAERSGEMSPRSELEARADGLVGQRMARDLCLPPNDGGAQYCSDLVRCALLHRKCYLFHGRNFDTVFRLIENLDLSTLPADLRQEILYYRQFGGGRQ